MTADLDTRAREAAASLRRAAADLDRPRLEPEGRRRAVRPGRWLVVGAVVAVVAVAVVAVVAVSGPDEQGPVTAASGGVPILVPEAVPEGLEPTGAVDLPLTEEARGPERLTVEVFGDPNAGDPFASADLGVTVFRSQGVEPGGGGRQLTVRGVPAWMSVDGACRSALMWQKAPGVLVVVTSGTLGEADLVAVAERLTFSADHTQVNAPVLPPGLALVGAMAMPVSRGRSSRPSSRTRPLATWSGTTTPAMAAS